MAEGSGPPSAKTRHIPEILMQLPKGVPPWMIPKGTMHAKFINKSTLEGKNYSQADFLIVWCRA